MLYSLGYDIDNSAFEGGSEILAPFASRGRKAY
jgi:hypothetical protein